jgi:hypothetical protein
MLARQTIHFRPGHREQIVFRPRFRIGRMTPRSAAADLGQMCADAVGLEPGAQHAAGFARRRPGDHDRAGRIAE